jgi:hypothetical protein
MKKSPSLLFCLAMDLVGMATFLLPAWGEFGDLIWAPLSAIIFYKSFGGKKGVLGAVFSFIEEAVPFLDFIPTFTIAWMYYRFVELPKKQTMEIKTNQRNKVIDIH